MPTYIVTMTVRRPPTCSDPRWVNQYRMEKIEALDADRAEEKARAWFHVVRIAECKENT